MKQWIFGMLAFTLLGACAKNAATGRKQLSLVSNAELMNYSKTQYTSFLQKNKVVTGTEKANKVKKIGSDIAMAITRFYKEKGQEGLLAGYNWEYNLVESKEVNAWCMPGGKIVVYTGILPVAQNDNALAAIIGHEVAHAIAEHGKERVSSQMLQEIGAVGLSAMVASKPVETQKAFMTAFGVASTYGAILPFSRKQELEADKLGLIYAAYAGYDPREAIGLWERMGKLSQGQAPPEFASTHPAEATRIEALRQQMPEAMTYYEKARSAK